MTAPHRHHHLHQLLQALQPRDATESGHRARMLELLEAPGDPFAREHYIPGHFTASAFVVSPERDALLMILHDKLGLWLQPGGHVEPSDADVVAAARREVAEEVQLQQLPLAHDGIFDVDIHVVPARRDAPAHQHFDVRFLFEAAADSGRASSDVRDARWIRIDDIGSIHTDESVMRAVRKLSDLRRGAR